MELTRTMLQQLNAPQYQHTRNQKETLLQGEMEVKPSPSQGWYTHTEADQDLVRFLRCLDMVQGPAPASIVRLSSWHSFGQSHRAVRPCLAKSVSEAKPTRRFSFKKGVICWSCDHSSLHMQWVQKQASGTWCRWQAVPFVALPRAHKMLSVSYSWISHSLSRGVKDYIRSLTYIGLNSCSRAMEETNLGKNTKVSTCPQLSHPRAMSGASERSGRALRTEKITTCTKGFHPNGFACTEGLNCDIAVGFWLLSVNT